MGMRQTPLFIEILLECLPDLRSPPHLCLLYLGPGPLYSKTVLENNPSACISRLSCRVP